MSAGAAGAAARLERIDRTVMGLSATARGLAAHLTLLEGKLGALRAESARTGVPCIAETDAAALADTLAALIESLRAAIGQVDKARVARAAVVAPLADSAHAAAAVGARAARLAGSVDPAPSSLVDLPRDDR
ncbi:MAG: hypothetical protein ACTSRY_02095 [Alphaproteobacteria bacterium]